MKSVAVVLVGIIIAGFLVAGLWGKRPLKVFHAGSLAIAFEQLESRFEPIYGVNVQLEPSGSVEAVRKITELDRSADILALSDYSLFPTMMFPEHADWYIQFARNRVVIAYTSNSDYAREIDNGNWYEILQRPGVKFGFGDPNSDPCGYRTLFVVQLAELYYGDDTIFDNLIERNTSITSSSTNGEYIIEAPENPAPNTEKVRIELKEVDLVPLLQLGVLDYAFEYKNVAVQHAIEFLELPDQIDLSSVEHENVYKSVRVKLASGDVVKASPIVYGLTIPKGATRENLAIEFVKFLLGGAGREIFERVGFEPLNPPVANDVEKLPANLRSAVIS
jgi:molybdate/tungstate transport system substrate-binding protein